MRTIPEVVEDIKSILNNIERTENCDGETLVDINELADEILTISTYNPNNQTNADCIRSMSDDELAEWLTKITDDAQLDAATKCDYQWKDWLQSEVEE